MTDAVDWQTPQTDSFRSRGLDRRDEMGLDQQARFWSTPSSHDGRRPGSDEKSTQERNLKRECEQWPTPRNRDWKTETEATMHREEHKIPLTGIACRFSPQDPETGPNGNGFSPASPDSPRRRLNPDFVAWLQGMPHQWADITASISCERMATWRSRFKSRLRFLLSGKGSG
jgi:DNA (cytosine-5)-methyltransferase 1